MNRKDLLERRTIRRKFLQSGKADHCTAAHGSKLLLETWDRTGIPTCRTAGSGSMPEPVFFLVIQDNDDLQLLAFRINRLMTAFWITESRILHIPDVDKRKV
jgi:hypothetical protein